VDFKEDFANRSARRPSFVDPAQAAAAPPLRRDAGGKQEEISGINGTMRTMMVSGGVVR